MNIFDAPPKDAEWFLTKCEAVDLIHRNIETGQATGGDINHLKAIAGSQNPELSELSDDLWLSAKRLQDAVKTAIVALANRVGMNAKELENEIFSAPSVSWLQAAAKIGQSQPITMPDRNAGKQGDETKRPRKATANELMLAEIERRQPPE